MSTKRANIPFSQSKPLFTVRTLPDGAPTSKVCAISSSIESNEIALASEHGFASLVFKSQAFLSTTSLTVAIKYRVKGTDTYSDAVTIDTVSHSGTKGYAWRLDAKLGINWIPNNPFKIVFTETGGLAASTLQGVISV